ncbi:MAG: CHASE2 domain-containing protein [Bacillota bacterium]|nr:CHASE2 domain-containing protein [Bacillota bacterium]
MAKKRAKFLETRIFGFAIAAAVIGLIFLIDSTTGLIANLELKTVDSHFRLKDAQRGKTIQEGTIHAEKAAKISEDILIVGVDFNTLSRYGKWPFARTKHADLVNAFSRIRDQDARENTVLLDFLFIDPDLDSAQDQALADAIATSGRVFLETSLKGTTNETATSADFEARDALLYERLGTISSVTGDWRKMPAFYSSEPPLAEYSMAAQGYGHANYLGDTDNIFRRQPMVARASELVEMYNLDDLIAGFTVDSAQFERLAWMATDGTYHDIKTPLTEKTLSSLRARMIKEAPLKVVDNDGDGAPDEEFYIIRKFRDRFVPSITLSIAANYFGVAMSDIEVKLGESIRIPSPTRFDPDSGERYAYEIQLVPDEFDAEGNLVKEGVRRAVPEIEIPIDENGAMIVNFMGPASSDSADGIQTYPIRSYAGYADKAPGVDRATWRRSMAVGNKIIMVGAFARGMAADEKTTPFGLMYGIEIHANALNTILMDNFLRKVPAWVDALILVALAFFAAFLSSRLSTVISFLGTFFLIAAYFITVTMLFDARSILVSFSAPAVTMLLTFISIVVYRAMTEERDKKRIRETFGKYVSPEVVDQLVDDPPELGGVDKELTVMFSDIRGFTSISERMTPQELINHLNVYLTAMTDIILESGGTLDKYIGDAIMAFWGAPLRQDDHAERACKAALRQMERLRELNVGWPEPLRINIGIGLNSGIMTVGNMGSPTRMNYTLAGDNVNLGSRLEGTNKEYGTNIIISESTYGHIQDKFLVRELDNIRVKGKNQPVGIYELVDCVGPLVAEPLPAKGRKHAKA